MNMLQVSANFPPRIGGPATSVPELAKRLAEKGHEVHVLTVKFPGYEAHEMKDGYYIHRATNINKDPTSSGTVSNLFSVVSMGVLAHKIIPKYDIDIVHAHDLNLSAAAGILSIKFNKKPLITKYTGDLSLEYLLLSGKISFEDIQDKYEKQSKKLPFTVRFFDRFQKYFVEKSTVITAPSEFQKNMLLSLGADDDSIVVLRNAIDLNKFNPNVVPAIEKKGDEKIISYAGRLIPWKGVEYLIKAFAKVDDARRRSSKLLIVGDGPSRLKLQKLSQQLGIVDSVIFTGRIPNNLVPSYIASSDIVVLPSLYDPFPHNMLETLAMKKPLIATSIGGIPEVVKHKETGYLVNPGSSDELAGAIEELMRDDVLIKRISEKGYEHVTRNYSWDVLIDDFVRLYEMARE